MPELDLPKAYEPQSVEADLYDAWEGSGLFNPDTVKAAGIGLPSDPSSVASAKEEAPSDAGRRRAFSIAMPPPNATGTLHLGHATFVTLQDLFTRYRRMKGEDALWLPGVDHAAIATQNKVEKLVAKEGTDRFKLGREAFLARVRQYVEESKATIHRQMRLMGASCDWSRERYTLDEGLSVAVRQVFSLLFQEGLLYRGPRIVNWCPRCQSTLADDEVEYQSERTPFYYLRYGPVVIATARPETKFQDKTIVVHPDDERYQDLVGKEFEIDWIDGQVQANVIADTGMDMALGTGAMTITPGHSFEDFELAKRHNLPIVSIIDQQGNLTAAAGEFARQNARQSRAAIVERLKAKGLVDRVDENYEHNLSVCYRCGTAVEPLVSPQWFVAVDQPSERLRRQWGKDTLKEVARQVVDNGTIRFIPERFHQVYDRWMENLHDWCISRQIWFGHQVPAFFCRPCAVGQSGHSPDAVYFETRNLKLETGLTQRGFSKLGDGKTYELKLANGSKLLTRLPPALRSSADRRSEGGEDAGEPVVYVSDDPEQVLEEFKGKCPVCGAGSPDFRQDEDTLDTWFSSALWTFSTLLVEPKAGETLEEWLARSPDFQRFHPTSLMETGYDIIFFWIARMVLLTTYATGQIPFRVVYLHGLVRDEQGRKMSKSLDNGIDPVDMVAKYGADATRLSLVVGTTPGNDQKLSEQKVAGFRNFTNKLWNVGRFILMSVAEPRLVEQMPEPKTMADKWILSRLAATAEQVTQAIEDYEISRGAEALYEFTRNELADWYLEMAKVEGGKDEILLYSLQVLLKLWHPYMPFVTEELWRRLGATQLPPHPLLRKEGEPASRFQLGRKSPQPPLAKGGAKGMLMVQQWPTGVGRADAEAGQALAKLQEVVTALRQLRSEVKVGPAQVSAVQLSSERWGGLIEEQQAIIERLARVRYGEAQAGWARQPLGDVNIAIDLSRPIDPVAQAKERQELGRYIASLEQRLGDQKTSCRAPAIVVAQWEAKLGEARVKLEKLKG